MVKKISLSVVSLSTCLGLVWQVALAASVATQTSKTYQLYNLQEFKLQPRFSVLGFTGDRTFAESQFLAPLYGDQSRAFYTVVEGTVVDKNNIWLGGVGFGYRHIVSERIWGGYIAVDYANSAQNGFALVKPGMEMFGKVWDVTVKGYIPVDNRKKLGEKVLNGDYDRRLQLYAESKHGFDFEVAREIPFIERAKLHLGAYHFDTADFGSTNGIETRLTYALNKYSGVELKDSYDNIRHNVIIFGIRITFGGYSVEEKREYGIAARLLDPISPNSSGLVPIKGFTDKN